MTVPSRCDATGTIISAKEGHRHWIPHGNRVDLPGGKTAVSGRSAAIAATGRSAVLCAPVTPPGWTGAPHQVTRTERTRTVSDSEIRRDRSILERIESELTGHLCREHDRDGRSADSEGRLHGRLDRIEAALADLGALIERLDARLERGGGSAAR